MTVKQMHQTVHIQQKYS